MFISGQKYFGQEVLRLCIAAGHEIVGVACPVGDQYIGRLAALYGIPIVPAGSLNADTLPDLDLGVTAHSFDYISKPMRYKASIGWIGYHPSLLPLHRGRSSIEWAIRMRERITGGTVFWLNGGIDRGDIERQDWCFIPTKYLVYEPAKAAAELWKEQLLPMGIRLISDAVASISKGQINRKPQEHNLGTFEPRLDKVSDIYRPDCLMLGPATGALNDL